MSAKISPVTTPNWDNNKILETSFTGLRSTTPYTFKTNINFLNFSFKNKISLISVSVNKASPFTILLSIPSPEFLPNTYIAISAFCSSSVISKSYSTSGKTTPSANSAEVVCNFSDKSKIYFIYSLRFESFNFGYSSNHLLVVIVNPAFSKPSSQVVKYLDSTSPEPNPPFDVFRAPEPINNTEVGFSIGNSSFLLRNKVHSDADSLRNWICLISCSAISGKSSSIQLIVENKITKEIIIFRYFILYIIFILFFYFSKFIINNKK